MAVMVKVLVPLSQMELAMPPLVKAKNELLVMLPLKSFLKTNVLPKSKLLIVSKALGV